MIRKLAKKSIPAIGDTERIALGAGTVSIDGKIFAGTFKADDTSVAQLSLAEHLFIHDSVPAIVKAYRDRGLTSAINKMKKEGVFGIRIPKAYGGLEFSPAANSMIMTAFATSGYPDLAVVASVPNSLGPSELIQHYGTEEQRNKYLPKLAKGMIPCFGLTNPNAGSDATSQQDCAKWVGDGEYEVTLDKRYITLAPIADLIGLAVCVEGKGLSLILVERNHPGLEIGNRHSPMGLGFPNGPIRGTIRFTDKHVLGELGKGWEMLVQCLSIGRAISLPALSVGMANMIMPAVGAYTHTRKQFGLPIYKFEAIKEKLADIRYHTYILNHVQRIVNGELNKGEEPAVLGAAWKYQSTERARIIVNHAMDITGGVGIQEGPNNWLSDCYKAVPIGVTVEGSNPLTRCLITFGQGLVRAHPHVQDVMDGAHKNSKQFNKGMRGLVKHFLYNGSKGQFNGSLVNLFAFVSDCSLFLGGKLKKSEYLSGRMADFFFNVLCIETITDKAIRRRLMWETKELYQEIVSELPAFLRPKLRLMGLRAFWGVQRPTKQHINDILSPYHEEAARIASHNIHPKGSRLWELQQILRGDHSHAEKVIGVDDAEDTG